jgi:glutaminyl-tRNA synthetase
VETIGVAKRDNIIDVSLLEFCIREDLNATANRIMAVLDPVKIIINNYPEDKTEWLDSENNPEDKTSGTRKTPFSKTIFIEREDFKEAATSKYFRLALGKEVRLKNAYIIKAERVEKDNNGEVQVIHCSYDTKSLSGSGTEASLRKIKGTLHWVSVPHARKIEVRNYDRLFSHPAPDAQEKSFINYLNPRSFNKTTAYIEPNIHSLEPYSRYQFQRKGYFSVDPDSTALSPVFNKTVGLRDNWTKQKQNQPTQKAQPAQKSQRKPIDVIKQLGKKYTNLPEIKQIKIKQDIQKLAQGVNYDELSPLFGTAAKKVGTRIAAMIVLKELLKSGQKQNSEIKAFIKKASEDNNPLLRAEALI